MNEYGLGGTQSGLDPHCVVRGDESFWDSRRLRPTQILRDLGVRSVRLLSNNPLKLTGVTGYGLPVVELIPLEIPASEISRRYLRTKREKLGHKLSLA